MRDDSDRSQAARDARRERQGAGDAGGGLLVPSEEECYVGDTVTLKGRNLPPGEEVEVVWHSVEGEWGVLEADRIVGPQYRPRTDLLDTVVVDDDGRFDEEWTVPQDYGGSHTLELQDGDGETLAEADLAIVPWFELDRTSAPLGETFRVTGYGLGPDVVHNNYQVTWDNSYVGFVTGVVNRGTATAEVRAVGPPGEHVLQVWRNHRGVPQVEAKERSAYGPVGGDRATAWTVDVTERDDEPRRAWVDGRLEETPLEGHYPDLDEDTDAELAVDPTSGQAGTDAVVTGRGFPPATEVDLVWYRHEGSEVRGIPITPEPRWDVLPSVTTDDDGAFELPFTVPQAEGSTRPVAAEVDGRTVAVTGFVVQPSIETFAPQEGPVGTEFEVELGGLGWTTFENNYHVVYDNQPLGYVSGTSDAGQGATVRTVLQAAGEPGYHFVDLYPGIYEMQDDTPDFELRPHLSYLDNHPVRPMPAIHLVFEVTE
jgi:hypothetical protein